MMREFAVASLRIFGGPAGSLSKRFPNMQRKLRRGGIMVTAQSYLSMMLMISFIVGAIAALNSLFLAAIVTKSLTMAGMLAVLIGFMGFLVSFAFMNTYPSFSASKRKRTIEEALPFVLSFMGILSGAGVAPKRIFRTLAQIEEEGKVGLGGVARMIFRDMELFGEDVLTALRSVSELKISTNLSGVFEGMISTLTTGGDLTKFFEEESRSLMRHRASAVKEFINSLVTISEMYMSLAFMFPLILIVMLVVMSFIGGGGGIGGTSPDALISLIIYFMIPMSGVFILLFLDSISPK